MNETLKNFMQEHFPFDEFKEMGFFKEEIRDNFEAQAERVYKFFGFKTVYEYGAKEVRGHLSYDQRPLHVDENGQLQEEPFITVIPSIYE